MGISNPNLEISTIVGCRMNCDYCPQKIHVKTYVKENDEIVMTLANFKKALSTVPKDCEIVFAGMAEPWLNPECTNMVAHAIGEGYKVGVYSTGAGMTETDALACLAFNWEHFTLHLPDADGRMKLKVDEQYLKIVSILNKIPGRNLMVIGRLHPLVEDVVGLVSDGSPGLFSRAGNLKHLAIPRKSGVLQCSACGPKIDHNILMPNGDTLLCCMDYAQKHVIGNLLRHSYADIFKSNEYKRVMKGLQDESIDILCRTCEVSNQII